MSDDWQPRDTLCPFCKKAYPIVHQTMNGDWAVSCYGCGIRTFDTTLRSQAESFWDKHVASLEAKQQKEH